MRKAISAVLVAVAWFSLIFLAAGAQEVDLSYMEQEDWVFNLPSAAPAQPVYVAESAPVSGGYGGGVEQWRPAASEACGGDIGCTEYVLGVIACESGGDPNAVGPNGELGILQVDPAYWGVMGSVEQIYFLLNPPAGAWWVCG